MRGLGLSRGGSCISISFSLYSFIGEGFEIVQPFLGLFAEFSFHEGAEQFGEESFELDLIGFGGYFCLVVGEGFEVGAHFVVHVLVVIKGVEVFGEVVGEDRLDEFDAAFAIDIDDAGGGTLAVSLTGKGFVGLEASLPLREGGGV